MSVDSAAWVQPYECATEISGARTIGPFPARVVVLVLMGLFVPFMVYLLSGFVLHLPWRLLPAALGLLVVLRFAILSRGRHFEDALPRIMRHWSLPGRLEAVMLDQVHVRVQSTADSTITTDDPLAPVRAVIEIDRPINLRLMADEDIGSYIRRFATFLNGLRAPVHLVIRTTPVELSHFDNPDPRAQALWKFLHTQSADLNLLERRWYIAFSAPSATVLHERTRAILDGIRRAGLQGHQVDGKLRDTLNACWGTVRTDGLGPRVIKRTAEYASVDGMLVRGLLVQRLPRSVDPNWLAPLLDGEVACDVSLWVEPLDNGEQIHELDLRLSDWLSAQELTIARSNRRNTDLDVQIADAQRMRVALTRHQLRLFNLTLLLVVRSTTRAGLDLAEQRVVDLLREQVGTNPVLPTDLEHDLAARQVVPLGVADLRQPLTVETPALARTYLWSSSSLAMPGGVPWGIGTDSKRPVLIDPFQFPNPHMFVAATSGAGKGYSIKVFLYRWFWLDPDVSFLVIDQDEREEYTRLAESVGGEVYRVRDADEPAGAYHGWLRDGTWHVPSVRRMRVYNLSALEPSDRPLAIRRLVERVEHESLENCRPGRKWVIVIDELWTLLDPSAPSHAGETIERLWRTGRHGRVMGIGVSQRPSDALNTERGQVLLDISSINWFLWCRPTEMARTVSKLGLTPGERAFLEDADQGAGILTVPGRRLSMRVVASEVEHRMAST
jgi:hypothetical protein